MNKSNQDTGSLPEINQTDAVLSTFMLFVQTAQIVLKYVDACLYRKMRLSVSKLIVLKALARSKTMTPSELALWTNTERHNVTTLVNRMKREGLINAGRQTNNKRYVNIELTDKGREVANQAIPIAKEIIEQIMSSMTKDDVALLKDELKIVRQNAHHGLTSFTSRYEP